MAPDFSWHIDTDVNCLCRLLLLACLAPTGIVLRETFAVSINGTITL